MKYLIFFFNNISSAIKGNEVNEEIIFQENHSHKTI